MIDISQQQQNRIDLASRQQQKASDPAFSVWVEASAGTGKTQVLSDRVLRLLLEGADPARILCLTYTKAAASVMNNRIIERLSKWAIIDDMSLEKELRNLSADTKLMPQARRLFAILLDTPGGLKIQTIHSFCQEILKRFPLEAHISPYFEVMDERETSDILNQIKQDILTDELPSDIANALDYLTSNCSEYSFPKILSSITDNRNMLENYFSTFPDFKRAIANISTSLNINETENLLSVTDSFWQYFYPDKSSALIKALQVGTSVSQEVGLKLATYTEQRNFDGIAEILLTKDGQPKKNFLVKKSQEAFPLALSTYQETTAKLLACMNKIRSLNLRDSTIAMLTVSREILTRYQNYKFTRSKIDYNDLIVKTKNLLNSPHVADWVLYKLDGGIDHILIDEAQDTSPEQWAIVQALSKEFFSGYGSKSQKPTVFVVGDRKQSIYSFQGADIYEFEKIRRYFADSTPDFKIINMEVSFRSTSAILDMVNAVFINASAQKGVISDNQNLNHIPSRIGEKGRVELHELTYPKTDSTTADIWLPPVERIVEPSASSLLAQKIAELIRNKVTSKELKADGTPIKYRDFLILVQRRNSFVEEIVRACKNADVAIAGIDKINLTDQIAVCDLLAAARFALLPEDDLNLACLLKSPIFQLDDEDLFTLCHDRDKTSLWQRLKQNSLYTHTAQILQTLYEMAPTTRPFEFFSYILNTLQGRRKFIARLSSECEDAIDEFINLTLSFEQKNISSLQTFVEWVQSDDVEIKRSLEQNDLDAVRLMTVHGSKGLQAPIVILPDTTRFKDVKQEAGWLNNNNELFYPLGKDYYNDHCAEIQTINQEKTLEEYNRLLYVALTRAGEQLYIYGYSNKNTPNEKSWYEVCRQTLSKMTSPDSQNSLVYNIESVCDIAPKKIVAQSDNIEDIPLWLTQNPSPEAPLARPLTPSHQEDTHLCAVSPLLQEDKSRLYSRGNIIHRLLQFLPSQPVNSREENAEIYLQKQASNFSLSEQKKILREVMSLVSDKRFAPLFGANSLAEVSVMGQVGDHIISGQIDRLVITKDKVMIIDYKTNRPAAQSIETIPTPYVRQMQAYKQLLSLIYPDKKIETYILWTNTATIMKLD